MQVANITFDRFNALADDQAQSRILAAREKLGQRAVILGHHYQQDEVIELSDLRGDSL
ncbi:MAG: quinolinate synthase NadA, partial [Methyloversatilis sp.]|nr:quinolinate synthase NadA [Methyloversatilis sp.]